MLLLYHSTTSVCAIKVRLTLAEKALEWEGELLDLCRGDQHRPEYLELNPSGVVPTLVHDGRVLLESTLIAEYLDDSFAAPPLLPADAFERWRARAWMKRIDDVLNAASAALTFAIVFRHQMLSLGPEALAAHLARIPNPASRDRQRLAIARGLASPQAAEALGHYDRFIADMDAVLRETPYLAGSTYSLADIAATPYVDRAEMLGLDRLWSERQPVADWLERMRERPSFEYAVSAWLSDADRDRFARARDETRESIEEAFASRATQPHS